MSRHVGRFYARIGRSDLDHLPQSMLDHAARCPACSLVLEQTRTIHRLVGLKRYEQPPPETVDRGIATLHHRLVEWEQERHLLEMDDTLPALTGWRYGWAAALLAVLAFNLMAARQVPSLQSSVAASVSPYHSVSAQFASSNSHFRFEAPASLLAPVPTTMEVSGRQTILTSFDR